MNRNAHRISQAVTVAVVGATFGVLTTFAVASGSASDQDPSSFHPEQRAAIAQWANEHRMTGLSPASLQPIGD